jgi:hypothetical protein
MAYTPLQLGSPVSSAEAIQSSLKKISEMLAELYTTNPELLDWNNFDKSIIPNIDSLRDLGSPTRQWRSLYVSNDTIYIGGTSLSVTESGSIQVGGNTFNPVVSYNDLTNRPTLFSGSYNSLTDRPALFSGSYNSLTDRPALFSGSYNDLTNTPSIPSLTGYATESFVGTAISNLVDTAPTTLNTLNELAAALGDDANFASTVTTQLSAKANTSSLALVATSGSYIDLTNKPTLFSGSYNDLTNRPTLFSGSYNSLTDRPTLFSGAYADLSGKPILFSGSYVDLTNKPTIPSDISNLTDINGLLGGPVNTGNVTFSGNTITVSNANPLTITPVLTLSNNLNATNINLTGTITSQASGTPEIVSDNEILLDAGTRVELVGSPIKMANLTTGQRDALIAENGDVIYNLSTNKFQGYANGVWVDLH